MKHLTRRRLAASVGAAALLAAAAVILCPLVGYEGRGGIGLLDPHALWRGLHGQSSPDWLFWYRARLPRALAALTVGGGLAAAGVALQAALRNPLAEPFTLGISSGASLAAILAFQLGVGAAALGGAGITAAALAGSALSIYLVWRLGRVGASLPAATLLLAGITVASFCSAANMLVLELADFGDSDRIVHWMMGSFEGTGWPGLLASALPIAAGIAVLLLRARDLNALAAGEEAAASVGVAAGRATITAFAAAALIVGAAIALGGPIGFVGLIVPHIVRGLVGPDHRVLLPTAALTGGALLVVADSASRIVIAPDEIQVGILTALVGAAFFLYLVVREKRSGRLWGG
ncbi:MAG TPA: iron ABC transporter permease [Kofleriaceae bacterium]|nr:iron ABC transporter permease [Kofleriaceae bacterium]